MTVAPAGTVSDIGEKWKSLRTMVFASIAGAARRSEAAKSMNIAATGIEKAWLMTLRIMEIFLVDGSAGLGIQASVVSVRANAPGIGAIATLVTPRNFGS